MANRTHSTDPRAARAREQMKEAALALVKERRVETISVADIVARASVSRQAFYQHFADRDDVVSVAVTESMQQALNAVAPAAELTPNQRIDVLMRHVMANRGLYPHLFPGAASQRLAMEFRAALKPACEALVREYYAGVVLRGIPAAGLTTFLLGGLMEILSEWVKEPADPGPDGQAADLIALFRTLAAERESRQSGLR